MKMDLDKRVLKFSKCAIKESQGESCQLGWFLTY